MNIETLRKMEKEGKAQIIDTALEGTCELWHEIDGTEWVVLCDNTVITRREDLSDGTPVFSAK